MSVGGLAIVTANFKTTTFKTKLDEIKKQSAAFFKSLEPEADNLSPTQLKLAGTINHLLLQAGNALILAIQSTPLMTDKDVRTVRYSVTVMSGALRLENMVQDRFGNWAAYHPLGIPVLHQTFTSALDNLYQRLPLLSPVDNTVDLARSSRVGEMRHFRRNTAFILMQIDRNNGQSEDVKQGVKEVFDEFGISAVRADDIEHDGSITQTVLDQIETSEFLFADLSGERPNVYYEIGYAHALGRRVMMYRKKETKLHFDLSVHNVKEYDSVTELKSALRNRLVEVTGAGTKKPKEHKTVSKARRRR